MAVEEAGGFRSLKRVGKGGHGLCVGPEKARGGQERVLRARQRGSAAEAGVVLGFSEQESQKSNSK